MARSLNVSGAHYVGTAVMAHVHGDLALPGPIVVRQRSHWSVSLPVSLSGESLLRSPWPVVPVAGFVPEDVPWPGDMVGAPEVSKYRAVCVSGSSFTAA
jgi:hypothetical protein